MEYEADRRGGYEEEANYSRDRSRSPRPDRSRSRSPQADRDGDTRIRDTAAENGTSQVREVDEAPNEGSNLFCTGINPRLTEADIQRIFEKYGDVENCSIMRDPHTRESRGFGFVKMVTSEQAEAARNALNGEMIEGRTFSIEKARRSRPRTPTPGKYFGPPKRDERRPMRGGYGGYDRGPRYGGGREDRGGYRERYDDRGYGRRDRDDYSRGGGGAGGYREERYSDRRDDRRDDRRGNGYERSDRGERGGYGDAAAPSRGGYDDERYARR